MSEEPNPVYTTEIDQNNNNNNRRAISGGRGGEPMLQFLEATGRRNSSKSERDSNAKPSNNQPSWVN
jgi:hypothetical protein